MAVPSMAAAMVPEYVTSSAMFWPLLTPDSTRSGRSGMTLRTAISTQSAGVPSIAK